MVNSKDDKRFKDIVSNFSVMIKKEYKFGAPLITVTLNEIEKPFFVLDKKISDALIDSIHCCVDGVIRMDDNFGIVQTSPNVLVLKTLESSIEINLIPRSLIDSARDYAGTIVGTEFALARVKVKYFGAIS